MKKLRQAGKAAKEATVYELREDSTDRSQRKGDLVCDDLLSSGKSTILDVGITYPLIDTNVNNKSTEERERHSRQQTRRQHRNVRFRAAV